MRKPISKQALRRALERVHADGHISWDEPIGTVVDRLWHEIERKSYNGTRKKPVSRATVRRAAVPELVEGGAAVPELRETDAATSDEATEI